MSLWGGICVRCIGQANCVGTQRVAALFFSE